MLLVSLSCPLPLLGSDPPPFITSLLLICSREMEATNTASGRLEVNLFCLRSGAEEATWYNPGFSCNGNLEICIASRLLLPISMQTKQDPREPVLLMALKIILHAKKLCLSVIIFLICVCWHLERICRSMSS